MFPTNSKSVDLVETTLQVVEDEDLQVQNIATLKQNIQQCQEFLNQMRNKLKETKLHNSKCTEILKLNNDTKNAYDETCELSREVFSTVHTYVGEIEESLSTINQEVNKELYTENEERMSKLKEKCIEDMERLEALKTEKEDEITKKTKELQDENSLVDAEYEKCKETWKNSMDKYGEQLHVLQSLNTEVELLEENLESDTKELTSRKETLQQKIQQEIDDENGMNEKILGEEEEIVMLLDKLNKITKEKEIRTQQLNERKKNLATQEAEVLKYERAIKEVEDMLSRKINDLTNEIESNKQLTKENEEKVAVYKTQTETLQREISEMEKTLAAVGEPNEENCDAEQQYIEANIEVISKENEMLDKDTAKLLEDVARYETEVREKEAELEALRYRPNAELLDVEERLNLLEREISKSGLDEEIETIEQRNKTLQLAIEKYQTQIKEYEIVMQRESGNKKMLEKEIENVTVQCEIVDKEIAQLENDKNKLLAPKRPALKRYPVKRQPRQPIYGNFDSDSSCEANMTHSQLLAKKLRK